jgi:hypothetical protein
MERIVNSSNFDINIEKLTTILKDYNTILVCSLLVVVTAGIAVIVYMESGSSAAAAQNQEAIGSGSKLLLKSKPKKERKDIVLEKVKAQLALGFSHESIFETLTKPSNIDLTPMQKIEAEDRLNRCPGYIQKWIRKNLMTLGPGLYEKILYCSAEFGNLNQDQLASMREQIKIKATQRTVKDLSLTVPWPEDYVWKNPLTS